MSSTLVDIVRAALFAMGHLFGGSMGAAIFTVSLLVRLALLPLTIRLARRAMAQQAILTSLQPQLERLKARHRDQPKELWRRTRALYRKAGYRPFSPPSILGTVVQAPLLAGVYGAVRSGIATGVRFLWIPNLARPDALLALTVAALTAAVTYLGIRHATPPGRSVSLPVLVGTLVALVLFWRTSAALLLSWGATTVGNVLQASLLARRHPSRGAA
ncbi:MAG: hypothetical protein E6I38_12375 [Chloroflexi bacterium]|nr:MAG: hypothetical protein E6I38_12375 [Chloroflexota bacterium]